VLGVNVSDSKEIALKEFARQGGAFPSLIDSSPTAINVIFQEYKCSGVPLHCMIDQRGNVFDSWYGYEKGQPRARKALRKLFEAQTEAKDPNKKIQGSREEKK
jgi:hypothetical protein